ncbi:proline--tRNA ligase [Candidatus Rickettsiella viridis]|uniref:Proline--tRNA ligase n=1 Tax=Candidatus Rickettsiella viridis TaxID=676208 RepID=A0A2Z5UWD5_9COXI|nr:proline--tRNA ligase [Candidatus Rickettsiella viridis]BBB15303.1 proline--tRNA ligase [Candidatus Rickettsiella viridis]
MRCSQLYFPTLKETPADAEVISHQLMLRAGMIRKLASGIYTWLPLGLRVVRKVEAIVRQEMNRIGAQEILMPNLQPAELWEESQRWQAYGPELLRITDRHKRLFCFGPTHEEVITALLRHEVRSYKQLPLTFYQIQTKFRDEIRPRFGVMRAREFLMKDAYSFHRDKDSLTKTYQAMYEAYTRIFTSLGLKFRAVLADTGNIGGSQSQEFQVLAATGEDKIFYSDSSDYAANAELATSLVSLDQRPAPSAKMEKVETPGQKTIAALSDYLKVEAKDCIKLLIVKGKEQPLIALVLRGDHELNPTKLAKLPEILYPLQLAEETEIKQLVGAPVGYIGPIGLSIPLIVDQSAAVMANFICGANEKDMHFKHVNWQRDCPLPKVADLREVVVGDLSPDGKGHLKMDRGIEVGHIFQLGNKYSLAMNARTTLEDGTSKHLEMGCYGIGVSRIVGAAIEQNHDDRGILWPINMAPFQVSIIPIGYHRSESVKQCADLLYKQLSEQHIEVLLDDRNERPGALFADMDLIGIPHRLVIKESELQNGLIKYKNRKEEAEKAIPMDEISAFLQQALKEHTHNRSV